MTQSQCGYCYHPDCSECFPKMISKSGDYAVREVREGSRIGVGKIEFGSSNPIPLKLTEPVQIPSMAYTAVALRDQIAIAALQGMLIKSPDPTRGRINPSDEKCFAEQAYAYADAMMKARSR